jgi:hypothetical protein
MLANAEENDEDHAGVDPVRDRERDRAYREETVAALDGDTVAWERRNHLERYAKVQRDKEVNTLHANFWNQERCYVSTQHRPTCGIETYDSGYPPKMLAIYPSKDVIAHIDNPLIFHYRTCSKRAKKALKDMYNSIHGLENQRQLSNPFSGFPVPIEPHDNEPFGYDQLMGQQLVIAFCYDREDGCYFWGKEMSCEDDNSDGEDNVDKLMNNLRTKSCKQGHKLMEAFLDALHNHRPRAIFGNKDTWGLVRSNLGLNVKKPKVWFQPFPRIHEMSGCVLNFANYLVER